VVLEYNIPRIPPEIEISGGIHEKGAYSQNIMSDYSSDEEQVTADAASDSEYSSDEEEVTVNVHQAIDTRDIPILSPAMTVTRLEWETHHSQGDHPECENDGLEPVEVFLSMGLTVGDSRPGVIGDFLPTLERDHPDFFARLSVSQPGHAQVFRLNGVLVVRNMEGCHPILVGQPRFSETHLYKHPIESRWVLDSFSSTKAGLWIFDERGVVSWGSYNVSDVKIGKLIMAAIDTEIVFVDWTGLVLGKLIDQCPEDSEHFDNYRGCTRDLTGYGFSVPDVDDNTDDDNTGEDNTVHIYKFGVGRNIKAARKQN